MPASTMNMNAATRVTRRPARRKAEPGVGSEQRFFLDSVDWPAYIAISDALGERPLRITYDRGRLEFMTLSRPHERDKTLLSKLIDILTEEFELPNQGAGSMTCRREGLKRGLEPDDSWYIGSLPKVIDKGELDLDVDPPPDLAVEVDVSRSSINRMGIYQALRIGEVWRFDGQALTVNVLGPDGEYEVVKESPTFPGLPIDGIVRFLHEGMNSDHNVVRKKFRQWVRRQRRKKKR